MVGVMLAALAVQAAADPAAGPAGSTPATGSDPLNTVGLALLAYGLVQLLSKVVDRLPLGRGAESQPGTGFTSEDRKRLERVAEQVAAVQDRVERLSEQLAVSQRLTGQGLDELRAAQAKLDNIIRKLRALWLRLGRRRKDRG